MAKSQKTDRRAVVDQLRSKQKSAERRRNSMIVGVALVIALLIVGAAAYRPIMNWWDVRKFNDIDLATIGAPATACEDVTTKPADGGSDHVAPGTPMTYPDSPPAYGQHWEVWDGMERKFYTAADRPELGMLVHNLEHGHTILWYDETVAADSSMMSDVRGIAKKFEGTSNLRMKFKAVPWTSEDGDPFPDGQHVAFSHWSVGGADAGEGGEQVGVWQYCSEPSGEALQQFMTDYPYMDSPEPLVK
ncbi:DUF3105 domain-containing protein [Nocardioides sp.]|uniref:DUF3105 domain-containing protein n=1 Tax=Nocardioides sp. TaxID=35761 RepID=UPI002736AFF3|nr:DUF3105 domain-containing protein [Nocardioides sp.]MDP3894752.1 DUF3105 domain-containing protein [Nocardioides sp.]